MLIPLFLFTFLISQPHFFPQMVHLELTLGGDGALTGFLSGVPPGGVAEEGRFSLGAFLVLGCFSALFSSLMLA